MKNKMIKLLLVGLILIMNVGCTSHPTDGEVQSVEISENVKSITISYAYWQENLTDYLQKCADNFENENNGVEIVLECTSWTEYWTKLETAATGGSVADTFQMNGINITKYAVNDILLPLDTLVADSSINMSNYPEAMNELYTVNNSIYGIPMDYDTIGLWYNKAIFDDAGLEYPTSDWSWDDLVEAATIITDATSGIYGINANYVDQQGFYNTIYSNGGYIVEGEEFGFDNPKTREGIRCWIDLIELGVSPSEISLQENEGYLQFMSGNLGMHFAGSWMVAFFSSEDSLIAETCDVVEIPLFNGDRQSVIHGKANCISAATDYPEIAMKWLEYLGSDVANQMLGETGAAIPAYLEYSSLFTENYSGYNMQIYLDAAENYAMPWPSTTLDIAWSDIMWTELVKAYTLDISLDEACDNITNQIDMTR